MKNKFIILALFIVTLPLFSSVLFKNVSPESSGTDESNVSTNTVSIVKSMEEMNIDVKISDGPVTVSSILSNESISASVLIYRPDPELNVIPSYISPSKVIVDVYDTFILIYDDKTNCDNDLSLLEEDSNTIFVQRLEANNVFADTITTTTNDINATSYNNELSYAPSLMNSRKYAEAVKNSNRKITVVVMDTGLYNKNSKVIPYVNLSDSYDFVNNDNNVLDNIDDHATTVTGTILDIIGEDITDNVNIINAKVLEDGTGSDYTIYNAIMQYANKGGVDIINCSFGSSYYSKTMEFAFDYAKSKGIKIICASGNEYSSNVCYPAAYDSTICVGAIDKQKSHVNFSNTGKEVDFAAPGSYVLSNYINNQYAYVSGTSIATPCITGYSVLSMLENTNIKTKNDLINHLKSHCQDLGTAGKDNYYGYGLPVYSVKATPVPTLTPTKTPSTPKPIISQAPTNTPKPTSTAKPTLEPSKVPTQKPIVSKDPEDVIPTDSPTKSPTQVPSKSPTLAPTKAPTKVPTDTPSPTQTPSPTLTPTKAPSNDEPIESEAPSTEPTESPKILVYFDANGGINDSGQSQKYVNYNDTYGDLPELTRDYYTFEGWFTAKTGGDRITSSTTVSQKSTNTLYAHWSSNPTSEWIKVDDMPSDAKIVDKKWKYVLTSYKESNTNNMPGWTLYDSSYKYSSYSSWSDWSTTPVNNSELVKVETKDVTRTYETGKTEYNYSHYKYWNTTYNNWYYTYSYQAAALNGTNITYHELGWSETEQFLYTKFGNSNQSYGTYINGLPYFNEVTRPQTRTETIKYYRYCERSKIYTYYFKKSEPRESSTKPIGNNISDTQMYVRFITK